MADPGLPNPVFKTPDGTDSPISTPGWTAQGVQQNVHSPDPVFPVKDTTDTPANVPGWTVQNAATGSDQNTVTGA